MRTPKAFSARSFILRVAFAGRGHVDNRLCDKLIERVIPVNQLQISQRAPESGDHRFNFIGAESSNGDQSMYGHSFIRLLVFDDDRFLLLA